MKIINSTKKYIFLVVLTAITNCIGLNAQNGLKIKKIFDDYANAKGVTMVQLTNESMNGLYFALYKSIIIKDNSMINTQVRKCLDQDEKNADKVKKMQSGTGTEIKTTTFLLLPKQKDLNRLVLYKNEIMNKSEQTTLLIYIETKNKPDEILDYILKSNK